MTGKVFLITGTSAGFGAELVKVVSVKLFRVDQS